MKDALSKVLESLDRPDTGGTDRILARAFFSRRPLPFGAQPAPVINLSPRRGVEREETRSERRR